MYEKGLTSQSAGAKIFSPRKGELPSQACEVWDER